MPDPLDHPVFVVGPPRSGTTLLRVILSRHPDVWILSETHLYDRWSPRCPGFHAGNPQTFEDCFRAFVADDEFAWLELEAEAVASRVHADGRYTVGSLMRALLAETVASRGVSVVGEKTPDHAHHLAALFEEFPGARVLLMMRDPVATVVSEFSVDAAWASSDPAVAAHRWASSVAASLPWRDDPRVLTVRLEDLVSDPVGQIGRAGEHIGVRTQSDLLQDDGGHHTYRHGRRDPWARVDPDAGSPDDGLTLQQREVVDAITFRLAQQLGYPRPRDAVARSDRPAFELRRLQRRLRAVPIRAEAHR